MTDAGAVQSDAEGPGRGCPSDATWNRVRSTAGAAADADFHAHLEHCTACLGRLEAISAEWSQDGLVSAARNAREAAADSAVFAVRLRAEAPPRGPRPPPRIDGLHDLVEIGRGGMGIVYRAHDSRLGRAVAVKVLTTAASLSPEGQARAEREARLLSRVDHPHVVHVWSVEDSEGLPAIVMEWIDGESLAESRRGGVTPLRDAVGIVRDLAGAVAAIHAAGIIHRDIKPANVLLAAPAAGGRPVPKLVDFGLARPDSDGAGGVTRTSAAIGTPAFMAPEQTGLVPALGPVGPATDIHALGALLYWLLCGKAPYEDRSAFATLHRAASADVRPLSRVVPSLPADVDAIVRACLARRPGDRYPSARALTDDLVRFLDGRRVHARRPGVAERLFERCRRRPLSVLAVAAGLATSIVVMATPRQAVQTAPARPAMVEERDDGFAAEDRERRTFDRLTEDATRRLLARGKALGDADRDHLRAIAARYRDWPLGADAIAGARYRAAGLERVARLFSILNSIDDSLASTRAAVEALDDAGPAVDGAARLRLLSLETDLLGRGGRFAEAEALLRPMLARMESEDGAGRSLVLPRALVMANLALVEDRAGRLDEAKDHFERSVALIEEAIAEAPEDVALRSECVPALYNAAISRSIGGNDAKLAAFGKLAEMTRTGLDLGGGNRRDLGRGLVRAEQGLATHEHLRGHHDAALEHARRMEAAVKALAAEMPKAPEFADQVASAAVLVYRRLADLGRPGDAEQTVAEAVAHAEQAVRDEPSTIRRTRGLAEILECQANMFVATGRRPEAIDSLRRLVSAILPWTEGEDADDFLRDGLTRTRSDIARLLAEEEAAGRPAPESPTGEATGPSPR